MQLDQMLPLVEMQVELIQVVVLMIEVMQDKLQLIMHIASNRAAFFVCLRLGHSDESTIEPRDQDPITSDGAGPR